MRTEGSRAATARQSGRPSDNNNDNNDNDNNDNDNTTVPNKKAYVYVWEIK